ncbi:MAG: Gfo/Idh/MocA family oxidoreductase [Anaerolineae bacterium]|nr:Gfo/Idh/MocA family oxidoreductase [Anaerolineae bacterium]
MLRVGVIGYGGRVSSMARGLGQFGIPYRVVAIADPRADEIRAEDDGFLDGARFYTEADAMLADGGLDGVMIGTRCYLHTPMALKVAQHGLPLFLEKPVAISFDQVVALQQAYQDYPAPVVVSFPLRLTRHVQTVKEMLEADVIGSVEHVVATNDVPYGDVYFYDWYRNYDQVGGLFLQKATHDLDYVAYLLGAKPVQLCAMYAQRVYGGDKPHDLRCVDCDEWETCPESPFNLFYQRFHGSQVDTASERMCLFSRDIRNEDMSNLIVEYDSGAQLSYTQNVFARFGAARRGARLYGYRGTIDFDWYENVIRLYRHHSPEVETITYTGEMPHFGGDRELCLDFLRAMRDGTPSRSPIEAGIQSALTCLWARESAEKRRYCNVVMPTATD